MHYALWIIHSVQFEKRSEGITLGGRCDHHGRYIFGQPFGNAYGNCESSWKPSGSFNVYSTHAFHVLMCIMHDVLCIKVCMSRVNL